ncbi:DNA alkylation repair protein [Verrucomicrobiaceae bacterium N1E253]|uniref:DNA alkylation repair protein n=1 Tax=Oceaniferula marina TaxID=2748318 RepID=A0A851G9W4_9BACT|nr:DNA alkylation repair protein [Oceaniferula marina]NWK54518.1 DNA alkylation repair protein [Oceaniferula marina]
MATQLLMKDGLGEVAVLRIINGLLASGASFSAEDFHRDAMEGLSELELKQRVSHLIEVMGKYLPTNFEEAAHILGNIRDHWDEGDANDSLRSFAAWPVIDYISVYGLEHPKIALSLLSYLTPMYSAEFAIREFLNRHPEQTYNEMSLWSLSSDEHVRRLASEGIRPRLPWGCQLPQYIENPTPVIALLNNLVDDTSDYVRRSVANNLNDISKDHPELVIATCRRWMAEAIPARQWIIRHATRTLVKAGHPEVFALLGHTASPQIEIRNLNLSHTHLELGSDLRIEAEISSCSEQMQSLVIDYTIHFVKASGQTAPKVFKWKNLKLKAGETVQLTKKHPFKVITTRNYYAGQHRLEITVNGMARAETQFELFLPELFPASS